MAVPRAERRHSQIPCPDGSGQTASSMNQSAGEMLLLAAIVILAAALRFYSLSNKGLWCDEVNMIMSSLGEAAPGENPGHPFLYFLVLRISMWFGRSEFIVRLPAAIAGIAAIPLIYQTGKMLLSKEVGLVSAFLLAVSPHHIHYSQEAHSYALFTFLSLLSLLCLWRAAGSEHTRHWIAFGLSIGCTLMCHFFGFFVLLSEMVILTALVLYSRYVSSATGMVSGDAPRHRIMNLLAALAIIALLCAPLVVPTASLITEVFSRSANQSEGAGIPANPVRFDINAGLFEQALRKLIVWRASESSLYPVSVISLLVGLLVLVLRKREQALVFILWMIVPLLPIAVLSRSAGVRFADRRLIFILPVLLIIIAQGIVTVGRLVSRLARRLSKVRIPSRAVSLVLAVGVFGCLSVEPIQVLRQTPNEEWKEACALIEERAGPGDLLIQIHPAGHEAVQYYLGEHLSEAGINFARSSALETIGAVDLPADVWWLLLRPQPANRDPTWRIKEVRDLVGSDFEIYPFYSIVVAHRKTTAADLDDFSLAAAKLLLVQAQLGIELGMPDYRVDTSLAQSLQAYSASERSGVTTSGCVREPHDPVGHVRHARAQLAHGLTMEAQVTIPRALALHDALYQEVRALDADGVQVLLGLGDAALADGDLECAVEFCSRALEADPEGTFPENANRWRDVAQTLLDNGRLEEAVLASQWAVNLAPNRMGLRIRLAWAHLANDRFDDAVDVLEAAIGESPQDPWPSRVLAETYLSAGHADQAVAAYQQILDIHPNDAITHFGLALGYIAQGQGEAAIHEFEKWLQECEQGGVRISDFARSVEGLLDDGLVDATCDLAARALRSDCLPVNNRTNLAASVGSRLLDMGEVSRTIDLLSDFAPNVEQAEVWVVLAEAYEMLGDQENACAVLRQIDEWDDEGDPRVAGLIERLRCEP